jgi:hypothetical protein
MRNKILSQFRAIGTHIGKSKHNRNPKWQNLSRVEKLRYNQIDPKTANMGTILGFLYDTGNIGYILFDMSDIFEYVKLQGLDPEPKCIAYCPECKETIGAKEGKLGFLPYNSYTSEDGICPLCQNQLISEKSEQPLL